MGKVNVVDIDSPEFEEKINEILSKRRYVKSTWKVDAKTDLEWGPSSPKSMTHKEAQEYCKTQGGRLPTLQELQSLVDYTKHEPCLDKTIFPDTKNDYYWTSDMTAWNKNAYWVVSFGYGNVVSHDEYGLIYVRPVRASQ